MAKKYFSIINNGTEDLEVKDAEARDQIIKPIDLPSVAHSTTFAKNDAIAIDGKIYRCKTPTSAPPFPFVFQGNSIVTQVINGVTTYVVLNNTLNSNWELYIDTSQTLELAGLSERITTKQDSITNMAALGTGYGTCTTAGGTAAKVAVLAGYVLKPNSVVSILFTNGFTATSPTLNINGTGAKSILYYGSAITPGKVYDGTQLTMFYDGTAYNVIAIDRNTDVSGGDYVDLGLPSGLLWCTHNVGAESPEDYGLYFSWGNVDGHARGTVYDFGEREDTEPYVSSPGAALTGNISVGNTYDAARANMGAPWRMPTLTEVEELCDNCTYEWISQNGVAGVRFISKINGNTLFFPLSGYWGSTVSYEDELGLYWTSTSGTGNYGSNLYISFYADQASASGRTYRHNGLPVRAVK